VTWAIAGVGASHEQVFDLEEQACLRPGQTWRSRYASDLRRLGGGRQSCGPSGIGTGDVDVGQVREAEVRKAEVQFGLLLSGMSSTCHTSGWGVAGGRGRA